MSSSPGILLACDTMPGNPWARDRLPAIRAALAGREHEITDIYDFGSREAAHRIHRAKARGFFRDHEIVALNHRFRDRVLASKCRVVVLATADNYGHFLIPETIREVQRAGCFVVGILGDDEFTFEQNWPYAFLFDRVVAYVKPMVDRYNALRPGCCLWLPNSCYFAERNFELLQVPEVQKQHDVALFGSVFPARLRLVEKLVEAGISPSLFGGRGWLRSKRLRPFYRGFVASAEFDQTVRASRIVLALLEDHLTGAVHMNTKIWEAVRNGQMCLATRYAPLVEDYGLVEGEDIVFYDTASDLAARVRHYLAHPNERRVMAERLFKKIQSRFDYLDLYRGLFANLINAAQLPHIPITPANQPSVTLLGAPTAEDEAAGFPVWRFRRRLGWRRRIKAEFRSRVTTSHVLLASGRFRYDSCLTTWLSQGASGRRSGVRRIRTAGENTLGWDTLLWETSSFEAVMLSGTWWERLRARAADWAFPATRPVRRLYQDGLLAWAGRRADSLAARCYRALWRWIGRCRLAKPGREMVG